MRKGTVLIIGDALNATYCSVNSIATSYFLKLSAENNEFSGVRFFACIADV